MHCVANAASVGLVSFKANGKLEFKKLMLSSTSVKWHPLDQNEIKLNFDGSVSNNRVAIAFLLFNSNSQAVGEGAFNLDGATISVAEVMGLPEGLWFAKRNGFQKVYVEGDSKLII